MLQASSEGKRVRAGHDWFGFTSELLRNQREFFGPITDRRTAKPKRTGNCFQTEIKTALISMYFKSPVEFQVSIRVCGLTLRLFEID